jgi:hypothetical protein
MNLLEEIEQGAASEGMSLGALLRKCLILASRLGSKPAVDWVEWELNGYPNGVPVPPYRLLSLVIKANMVDLGKRVTGWPVPPAFLGERPDAWTRHEFRSSVGAIEHILSNSDSSIAFQMGNLLLFLEQQEFTDMEIVSAWGEASSSHVKNILETVRNRVLKFALDLGKEYPGAGTVKSAMSKNADKIDQIFINNIYGSANVVGTAKHSNVVLNVMKGDFTSLKQTLEENGVSAADINELKRALEQEPDAKPTGFGPKVSGWVGKMMKKVAEGTWKIASDVAGGLLGKALGNYYGVP